MFRRSGSVVPFLIEGELPEPGSDGFYAALGEYRFRSIEQAASEESSHGWVTQADPSGGSFAKDDIDLDGYFWLRMRSDRKVLPAIWLRIYRTAAERAAGRKLNLKERQDLRTDLQQKLLPRVLPAVALHDAVLFPQRRIVFLHATAKAAREAFAGLFFRSFRCSLHATDPGRLAIHLARNQQQRDYINQVSPVTWPRSVRPSTAGQRADPAGQPNRHAQTQGAEE